LFKYLLRAVVAFTESRNFFSLLNDLDSERLYIFEPLVMEPGSFSGGDAIESVVVIVGPRDIARRAVDPAPLAT
jgi:hypothetical protein